MTDLKIHVTSRGVLINGDHILLAYDPREKPSHYYELNARFFYLPGGHVDFQEYSKDALIREFLEETGYQVQHERFLGAFEYAWSFPGDEICCHTHEVNLIHLVSSYTLLNGVRVEQKEDHVAFKWVPINKLDEIDLRPTELKILLSMWLLRPL
jgi:8-oxo-dGTP pyrophosphatase MutT (NUDIX family)